MKVSLTFLSVVLIQVIFAQSTPVNLAKQMLDVNETKDLTGSFSDELNLRPGGIGALHISDSIYQEKSNFWPDFADLKSKYDFSFREFEIHSEYRIVNVTATDSLKKGFDFYMHFAKKGNEWLLTDLCRLEKSTVADLWMVNYSDKEVDSIISSSSTQKVIQSREQFEGIKQLYALTMSFDDTLIAYFNSNIESFKALKDSYNQFRIEKGYRTRMQYKTLSALNNDTLMISEIKELNKATRDFLVFYIRNTYHGSVGYLYVNDESRMVDLINNKKTLFVREIGSGWYLFKSRGK